MAKSKSTQPPAPPSTNIQIVCPEPVIIREPESSEETPPPVSNTGLRPLLLCGLVLALACAGWLAPAQANALLQNLIKKILEFAASSQTGG